MEGFSPRNLKYMRASAQAWSEEAIVQEALAQITWYHNLTLIEKLKEREERLWYAQETVKNGWSRNVLVHWIESDLYERQGKASTNFEQSMPRRQSDLARELLKDPYDFQFLTTAREAEEREIEQGLVAHIREFLLELGAGFAFLGQQFKLEVGGEEFFIDLLFYHVKLRGFVENDVRMKAEETRRGGCGKCGELAYGDSRQRWRRPEKAMENRPVRRKNWVRARQVTPPR